VPYAPKDILATKGILTTNGSKVTATAVPDYESTITARRAPVRVHQLGRGSKAQNSDSDRKGDEK